MQTTQLYDNATSHERDLSQTSIDALIELGRTLQRSGYTFTTITPASHQRVNDRAAAKQQLLARDLRDVFGWSRPFTPEVMPRALLDLLMASRQVAVSAGFLRSRVRFSSLEGRLLVHSAFPTVEEDAVFFGPDTYRFCALIQRWAPSHARCVIDLGAGTGAGALIYGSRARRRVAVDNNPKALAFARVNAALAGMPIDTVQSDLLSFVSCVPDLIIANPPYMRDIQQRGYRDGGGMHGEQLALRIVDESLARLAPRGELILYTGAAIVAGIDTFRAELSPRLRRLSGGCAFSVVYEELDPDVFGEELSAPLYADVDRIALIGLHIRMA